MNLTKKILEKLILEEFERVDEYNLDPKDAKRSKSLGMAPGNTTVDDIIKFIAKNHKDVKEQIKALSEPEEESEPEPLDERAKVDQKRDIYKKAYETYKKRLAAIGGMFEKVKGKVFPADFLDILIRANKKDGYVGNFVIKDAVKAVLKGSRDARMRLEDYFPDRPGYNPADGEQFRRALGLQGQAEQDVDKDFIRNYQNSLQNTPQGKAMIQDFVAGKIAIFHSISYESWASGQGAEKADIKQTASSSKPFSNWFKKFGSGGKNVISTIALNNSIEKGVGGLVNNENGRVVKEMGFLLKGFPVMVSATDVMSQNLGSIGQGLIDFQSDSGIAKRASGNIATPIDPAKQEWTSASEVLLDNWKPIGTFIHVNKLIEIRNKTNVAEAEGVIQDADSLGIPVYLIKKDDTAEKITSIDQVSSILGKGEEVNESANTLASKIKEIINEELNRKKHNL